MGSAPSTKICSQESCSCSDLQFAIAVVVVIKWRSFFALLIITEVVDRSNYLARPACYHFGRLSFALVT